MSRQPTIAMPNGCLYARNFYFRLSCSTYTSYIFQYEDLRIKSGLMGFSSLLGFFLNKKWVKLRKFIRNHRQTSLPTLQKKKYSPYLNNSFHNRVMQKQLSLRRGYLDKTKSLNSRYGNS